jgi:predicted transcriptional regulator
LKEVRKLEFPRVERLQTLGRLAVQPLLDILGPAIHMDRVHGTPAVDLHYSVGRRRRRKPRTPHCDTIISPFEKPPHLPFFCRPAIQDEACDTILNEESPAAKVKYRSKLRIYVDIMGIIQREGSQAKPTRICSGANLSHNRLVKYLAELKGLEVIQESESDEKTYRLTQKGVEFMNGFEEVEVLTQAFGFKL